MTASGNFFLAPPRRASLHWRDFQTFKNKCLCFLLLLLPPPCCSFQLLQRFFFSHVCRLSLWAGRQTGSGWRLGSAHSSPPPHNPHSQEWSSVETRATRGFKNQNAVCVVIVVSRCCCVLSGGPLTPDALISRQPISAPPGGGLAVFQL